MSRADSQSDRAMPLPRIVRLTPRGRGAVAVLRLEGAGALETLAPFFVRREDDANAVEGIREIGRIRYGRWRRTVGRSDVPAEDVVLCQVEPQVVEIHCHGGEQAPSAIVASLVESGRAVLIEAREAVAKAFPDEGKREAFLQLQRATAPTAARILWDQFQGAWPRLYERLRETIASDADADAALAETRRLIERALGFETLGRRLFEPWKIVLAGLPNVGKSSLVNRLVGYERAIAFDQPGTTRDVLVVRSVLAGLPVEFSDTAGLRKASDELESAGIARTRAALARADLVLLLADASAPWSPENEDLLATASSAVIVHHKSDLALAISPDRPSGIAVSSLTGDGVDELLERIIRAIAPRLPQPGEAVPIVREQVDSLRRLLAACDQGIDAVREALNDLQ